MNRLQRAVLAASLVACNAPDPAPSSGGVDLPMGPCGRGLAVLSSDYQSTNVGLTDISGSLVSPSFLSSASASTALSAPLSGDVVLPLFQQDGGELVVIDRTPAVLTWIDVATARVRAQLDVSSGFAANPRDYLDLGDGRAYVTRFENNPQAGAQSHDGGNDILVIDPRQPAIVGRIDLLPAMSDAPGFLPRASRMIIARDAVYVLLLGYNADFSEAVSSRLIRIEDDVIVGSIVLNDFYGCEGLAAHGDRLAISCSGLLTGGDTTTTAGSGLVIIDGDTITTIGADTLVGQPLGFAVAFTRAGVLVNALGALALDGGADVPDAILHVTDGAFTTVLRSESRPFELGDIRCNTSLANDACDACFVTDAERHVLHRLSAQDGQYIDAIPFEDGVGLPPRSLGGF